MTSEMENQNTFVKKKNFNKMIIMFYEVFIRVRKNNEIEVDCMKKLK